jgi:hypothetical protein
MKKLLIGIIIVQFLEIFLFLKYPIHRHRKETYSIIPNKPIIIQPKIEPKKPEVVLPDFIEWPAIVNRSSENDLYADIMNHTTNPFFNNSHNTAAHETVHGINNDIRNKLGVASGLYVGANKAVVIKEHPKVHIRSLISYIPKSLHSYRFQLYIENQGDWNEQPLYIFDEWVAYVMGSKVGIERKESFGTVDGVYGPLEFSFFSIALAMAVEEHDPVYWKENQQFRKFLIWHLKEALKVFKQGRQFYSFAEQEQHLKSFQTGDECKAMRVFVEKHLEGIWLSPID